MSEMLQRIDELLKQRDMKRSHLAYALELSSSYFTDWEKGKGTPRLNIAMKIADYFHVSLDWLAYGRGVKDIGKVQNISQSDEAFLKKLHSLPPELQSQVKTYMDGMFDALHAIEDSEKRLSS